MVSSKAQTMNDSAMRNDPAITFPFRPILFLMLAMGTLSLAGAGAAVVAAQPAAPLVAGR
jgi:hypothetical protein